MASRGGPARGELHAGAGRQRAPLRLPLPGRRGHPPAQRRLPRRPGAPPPAGVPRARAEDPQARRAPARLARAATGPMRSPAARLPLLSTALLLACAGCVALGSPAPPRLDTPPGEYGLLVVRVEMAYEGPLNFEGMLGRAVKLDSARLVRTETRTRIEQIAMPP